jgi:FAD/FMN-containing dehydrogenase
VATTVTTVDGRQKRIDDGALEELRTAIRGDVLTPADPGYADKPVYNAMHQPRPALIVRCAGTADVIDAVKFARREDLLVAVRGGGHSVAGHSSCTGGLVIDLTRMRGVDVDPDARIAHIQGGALWGDADREAQAFGLIVPGGVVSETGVAGLTLGGGEGWVRRRYGLTIDSLLSARVVCADGSVHTASSTSEPDLFWALRGGGGNFGIVTSFEFRAHPLGPIVAFAGVFYPVKESAGVLRRWRDYCSDAPDEVTSVALAITIRSSEFASHDSQPGLLGDRGGLCRRPRPGYAADGTTAPVGSPVGRHFSADALPSRTDGIRSVVPDGKAPELLESAESRPAAGRRNRHHRRPGAAASLASDACRDFSDGRRDQSSWSY